MNEVKVRWTLGEEIEWHEAYAAGTPYFLTDDNEALYCDQYGFVRCASTGEFVTDSIMGRKLRPVRMTVTEETPDVG